MDKILFIDTLTTGMNQQRCGIYSIGGIFCINTTEEIKEKFRFDFKIRPAEDMRINDNSLWIGGVNRTKLLSFEDEKTVLKRLTDLLDQEMNLKNPFDKIYLSGYNTSAFDAPFLRYFFERNQNMNFRDYFYAQTIDIMTLSTIELLGERMNMSDFHLESVARKLGIMPESTDKYSCVENARLCMQMFAMFKGRLGYGKNKLSEPSSTMYLNY